MSFTRFDAFTDAMFAIVITLLVIEIKVPDIAGATLRESIRLLLHLWPHLVGYPLAYLVASLLSFASLDTSVLLYTTIPIFYLLPSRIDKLLTKSHST